MQINIEKPDGVVLMKSADRAFSGADMITIDCPEMYEHANTELKMVKKAISALDEKRKSITKPIDEAKAAVMALFKPVIERLEKAESVYKQKMIVFNKEQQRLADIEQRRLDDIARLERERIQKEAAEKEDAARAERKRLQDEADKAEQEGRAAEAARLNDKAQKVVEVAQAETQAAIQTAAVMSAPAVEKPIKAAGTSFTEVWKGECFNEDALFVHAYQNRESRRFFKLDDSAIQNFARELKKEAKLPGCNFFPETRMSSRR